MSTVTNKVIMAGVVVRFFFKQRDAINASNARTKVSDVQHRPVRTSHGYLIERVGEPRAYFDIDGEVPAPALQEVLG